MMGRPHPHSWMQISGGHRCRRCGLERFRVGTRYTYFRDGREIPRPECAAPGTAEA